MDSAYLKIFLPPVALTLLLVAVLSGTARASRTDGNGRCSCLANPESKNYLVMERTWYGSKRTWTCQYSCVSERGEELVTGTYSDTYLGKDEGLEGICEGLVYENRYNPVKNEFTWFYERAEQINARKSAAPEIRSWAQDNC